MTYRGELNNIREDLHGNLKWAVNNYSISDSLFSKAISDDSIHRSLGTLLLKPILEERLSNHVKEVSVIIYVVMASPGLIFISKVQSGHPLFARIIKLQDISLCNIFDHLAYPLICIYVTPYAYLI